MRRTIRASGDEWVMLAFAWALTPLLALDLYLHPPRPHGPFFLSLLPAALGLGRLTAETVAARATVEAERVTFRSIFRSRRRSFPTDAIVRYTCTKEGAWGVVLADGAVVAPIDAPWDLHAAMVEFARRKLGAKRLRMKGLPPKEEFLGLPTFDWRRPPLGAICVFGLCLAVAAVLHDAAGVAALALGGLLLVCQSWGRLDVTDEGLALRTPFGTRRIAWSEAAAIFCENPRKRRAFVVVAPGRGIHIPAHLARDLEIMRKVLCSLPDLTPCVNFDASTLRGYRIKKRAQATTVGEDLMPALTT